MKLDRYSDVCKREWDDFVRSSRNGTFLFLRDYMDYHRDRFADHSLMFRNDKGNLLAVLPANASEGVLYSHQGLTYGGLVLSPKAHATDVQRMLEMTLAYLGDLGFTEWIYKPVPTVFHRFPSQEDEYWLWRLGATLEVCNLSCAVDLRSEISCVRSSRKSNCNKLLRLGYTLDYDCPLADFWPILEENLRVTYDAKPVHSLDEMERLKAALPNNIVCCVARNEHGEIEAGTVLFLMGHVAHTQYLSASALGKTTTAMDFLILELLKHFKELDDYWFFEFGTSNEQRGRVLNESLILQKEGLGGRGAVYKSYKLKVKK